MTQTIGFIGLGNMGLPMARNLLKAGFKVRVYNRSPDKAKTLATEGAIIAAHAADTVTPGGIVVTMLANDAAVEEVIAGPNGIAAALGTDGIHVSMSTIAPTTSRKLSAIHAQRGSLYVAAPVFGRPEAAAAKKLWICQSGATSAKERIRSVLEAMGQGIYDFGKDPSAASTVKLCGNFMILSVLETLGEAFALAEKSGLDRKALASFFGETIFACPVYQTYGRSIADRTYEPAGFRVELGLKDANLIIDAANKAETPMPLAHLVQGRMLAAVANGHKNLDWAAIELMIAGNAGLR